MRGPAGVVGLKSTPINGEDDYMIPVETKESSLHRSTLNMPIYPISHVAMWVPPQRLTVNPETPNPPYDIYMNSGLIEHYLLLFEGIAAPHCLERPLAS